MPYFSRVSAAPAHRPPVLSDRVAESDDAGSPTVPGRGTGSASDLIDRLVGLQAQAPLASYVALWSRLEDFETEQLSKLMRSRAYVRGHAMRSTIHLVSAQDFPALRALSDAAVALNLSGQAPWARAIRKVDRPALAADVRAALADGPLARGPLAERLVGRWGTDVARRPRPPSQF